MDEMERLGEECAAGQIRRDNGIKLTALGVLVLIFGIVVPLTPDVTPMLALALLTGGGCMFTSGRRKVRRALDGLVRELQEH
ncbi:hypothetical protein [Sinomonas sp.]|jgi:hypothetical protein|uniref:hypothetical protein n=1 Tax=Sinomonas sp. TaxID=1914986 RepID=UPI002FE045BD